MQFVHGLIQGLGTHDATTTILGYPTFSHTLCPQWLFISHVFFAAPSNHRKITKMCNKSRIFTSTMKYIHVGRYTTTMAVLRVIFPIGITIWGIRIHPYRYV